MDKKSLKAFPFQGQFSTALNIFSIISQAILKLLLRSSLRRANRIILPDWLAKNPLSLKARKLFPSGATFPQYLLISTALTKAFTTHSSLIGYFSTQYSNDSKKSFKPSCIELNFPSENYFKAAIFDFAPIGFAPKVSRAGQV